MNFFYRIVLASVVACAACRRQPPDAAREPVSGTVSGPASQPSEALRGFNERMQKAAVEAAVKTAAARARGERPLKAAVLVRFLPKQIGALACATPLTDESTQGDMSASQARTVCTAGAERIEVTLVDHLLNPTLLVALQAMGTNRIDDGRQLVEPIKAPSLEGALTFHHAARAGRLEAVIAGRYLLVLKAEQSSAKALKEAGLAFAAAKLAAFKPAEDDLWRPAAK